MRKMKFLDGKYSDFPRLICEGVKTTTIRASDWCDIQAGDVVQAVGSLSKRKFARLEILKVQKIKLSFHFRSKFIENNFQRPNAAPGKISIDGKILSQREKYALARSEGFAPSAPLKTVGDEIVKTDERGMEIVFWEFLGAAGLISKKHPVFNGFLLTFKEIPNEQQQG